MGDEFQLINRKKNRKENVKKKFKKTVSRKHVKYLSKGTHPYLILTF